jgi:hypothetical protein
MAHTAKWPNSTFPDSAVRLACWKLFSFLIISFSGSPLTFLCEYTGPRFAWSTCGADPQGLWTAYSRHRTSPLSSHFVTFQYHNLCSKMRSMDRDCNSEWDRCDCHSMASMQT